MPRARPVVIRRIEEGRAASTARLGNTRALVPVFASIALLANFSRVRGPPAASVALRAPSDFQGQALARHARLDLINQARVLRLAPRARRVPFLSAWEPRPLTFARLVLRGPTRFPEPAHARVAGQVPMVRITVRVAVSTVRRVLFNRSMVRIPVTLVRPAHTLGPGAARVRAAPPARTSRARVRRVVLRVRVGAIQVMPRKVAVAAKQATFSQRRARPHAPFAQREPTVRLQEHH